ncbi:MAG: hypothetical protein AAGA05_02125 [Pseudomonadota bacterium]
MSFKSQHELHQRRFGRNLGVAVILVAFIAIIFGLTVVKVTSGDFELPQAQAGL